MRFIRHASRCRRGCVSHTFSVGRRKDDTIMPDPVIISPTSPASTDATALIARLDAELTERYPDRKRSRLEHAPAQVAIGRGLFLIARVAGEPVGCGALRIIGS